MTFPLSFPIITHPQRFNVLLICSSERRAVCMYLNVYMREDEVVLGCSVLQMHLLQSLRSNQSAPVQMEFPGSFVSGVSPPISGGSPKVPLGHLQACSRNCRSQIFFVQWLALNFEIVFCQIKFFLWVFLNSKYYNLVFCLLLLVTFPQ